MGRRVLPISSSDHHHTHRSEPLEPTIPLIYAEMAATGFPEMKNDLLLRAARGARGSSQRLSSKV